MTWIAGASVFSGRPDPTWPISDELGVRLETLWGSLPTSQAQQPEPRPLGYRGCFVNSPDGRRWMAYRQSVTLEAAGRIERRRDNNRNFESTLLASAPDGVLPPWVND
jgi:hypothetical protein